MLITSLTIRAIHIELVHSLNCIIVIRNFIARRGTHFHGANNELIREWWQLVKTSEVQEKFTSSSTKWFFNPPDTPHMGGSWERLMGSVKKILSRIKPSTNPSDEVFEKFVDGGGNIVNSRPLIPICSN